jgi:hypothetical protein
MKFTRASDAMSVKCIRKRNAEVDVIKRSLQNLQSEVMNVADGSGGYWDDE